MRPSAPRSKNELKPWLKEQWCIPPKADAAFVCNMEDVLEVYKRSCDPKRPVVCVDEMPKQLLMDTRDPLSMYPGEPERFDYEYKRGGVADLFMLFEPLAGKRHIEITDQRRRIEWAEVMRIVSDQLYPDAEKIGDLSCITHQSMEAGSTWPKLNCPL